MFSSNQRFDVTCSYEQLAQVIDFAVQLAGNSDMFQRENNRVRPAWQITSGGRYALGSGSMAPGGIHPHGIPVSDGWTDYTFDYDASEIADIVWQWVEGRPAPTCPFTDGGSKLGIRVMCLGSLPPNYSDDNGGIKDPCSAIVVFEPFMLTYDK